MILGHETQAEQLDRAFSDNRLHHAYLLAGPKGVGKASFAKALLPQFLASSPGGPSAEGLLEAGAHPDFKSLQIEINAKTGKRRSEITKEQIDELLQFLIKHPAIATRKVVLIDAVDDLNPNAANAMLKWLEEPRPGTLLLLIAHRPDALLPTIASRCALVRFKALDRGNFEQFAAIHGLGEVEALFNLSGGVPGQALAFADPETLQRLTRIEKLLNELENLRPLQITAAANALLPKSDAAQFATNMRLLRHVLHTMAQQRPWTLEAYTKVSGQEALVERLNMDAAQVWSSLLLDLHGLARQS